MNITVSNYQVHFSKKFGVVNCYAVVVLYGTKNEQIYLHFMQEGTSRPNRAFASGSALVFWPMSMYSWVIDLLRNENPIYFSVGSSNPEDYKLSTSNEPIGEAE